MPASRAQKTIQTLHHSRALRRNLHADASLHARTSKRSASHVSFVLTYAYINVWQTSINCMSASLRLQPPLRLRPLRHLPASWGAESSGATLVPSGGAFRCRLRHLPAPLLALVAPSFHAVGAPASGPEVGVCPMRSWASKRPPRTCGRPCPVPACCIRGRSTRPPRRCPQDGSFPQYFLSCNNCAASCLDIRRHTWYADSANKANMVSRARCGKRGQRRGVEHFQLVSVPAVCRYGCAHSAREHVHGCLLLRCTWPSQP